MKTAMPFVGAGEHLLAELQPLRLMLQRQTLRLRAAGLLTEDAFRGLYIPDAHVDALLRRDSAGSLLPFDWDPEITDITVLDGVVAGLRAEIVTRVEASIEAGVELPLVRLAVRCGLSRAELDALLICAAPEIDLGYETLYAYVQNDVTKKHPTVDLVLALLSSGWSGRMESRRILTASAPLLNYRLLRFVEDPQEREPSFLGRFVKAEERVVGYLLGDMAVERTLQPFIDLATADPALDVSALPESLGDRLAQAARSLSPGEVLLVLTGADEDLRRTAARFIFTWYGLGLLTCDLPRALQGETSPGVLSSALCREAVLHGAGVYLSGVQAPSPENKEECRHALEVVRVLTELGVPMVLGEPLTGEGLPPAVTIELPLPDATLRRLLWRRALDLDSRASPVDLIAETFALTGSQIERAAKSAARHAALDGREEILQDDLRRAAREQSHSGLRRLAQKIERIYVWDDIILPPRAMQQLHEVRASIVHRHTVYGGWGFGRKLSLGKGINVLFYGPSGAGKTMAAQVLASDLGLDIFRIDLATVVSKYIGETEKNLSTIFREARTSNAILFFDEADALFGKRSEVKDAHDRYANIEVAYLLQQMEEYDGTVILATNLNKNLDDAFARRMHHTVDFPFPDATYREKIWRAVFPAEAPLAQDVNLSFLARQFELAGGNIRNVALSAAFLAADDGSSIGMSHLIHGTARELQKMGKLPSQSDFQGYYALIRERG